MTEKMMVVVAIAVFEESSSLVTTYLSYVGDIIYGKEILCDPLDLRFGLAMCSALDLTSDSTAVRE
jgi:hypothetical protein